MAITPKALRNMGSKAGEKTKELAHKAEDKAKTIGSNFKDQAHEIGAKVGEKSKELLHAAENKIKTSGSDIQDQAYEMGEKAKEYLGECEEKLGDGASYLKGQIKANPFIATGAAFVIGMLISGFLGGKR